MVEEYSFIMFLHFEFIQDKFPVTSFYIVKITSGLRASTSCF